jgi:hypothetical protein
MPPIIRDMPWVTDDGGEEVRLPDGRLLICPTTKRPIRILHDQLIVWASLAPVAQKSLPVGFPVFPLVIDSGFNDSFLMQSRQAVEWMSLAICSRLPIVEHRLPVRDAIIPNREAAVWLHPNLPGSRDLDPKGSPVQLNLEFGITLAPPGPYAREKPLLGMRAIRFNKLNIRIDGQVQRVWIDTP